MTRMAPIFLICALARVLICGPVMAEEPAWTFDGAWTGVASHLDSGAIYVLDARGRCVELNSAGKNQREIKLDGNSGSLLRLARLGKDAGPSLLTFGVWNAELRTYDANGKLLWNYPLATGIDDVSAFDLDGDQLDEVIVGYNGDTGVHVLDSKGQLLWKSTAIGNVWHVSAGNVWDEKTAQVVTTSAAGQVHAFSRDGKKQLDLDPGCYGSMVRVGKISPKDQTATIFVGGPLLNAAEDAKALAVNAFSWTGGKKWSLELQIKGTAHIDSAALAPTKPWLAVAARGGRTYVIDVAKGEVITTVNTTALFCEVGWGPAKANEAPLLLIAMGRALSAFTVSKP